MAKAKPVAKKTTTAKAKPATAKKTTAQRTKPIAQAKAKPKTAKAKPKTTAKTKATATRLPPLPKPSASGRTEPQPRPKVEGSPLDAAVKKQTRKGLAGVLRSKTPTSKTGRDAGFTRRPDPSPLIPAHHSKV